MGFADRTPSTGGKRACLAERRAAVFRYKTNTGVPGGGSVPAGGL
jgi:hypothetical protein